jgi:hypothetical protein
MSELSKPSNNGLVKTKWFKVYCPYVNENINVQGTWELAYANYLNKNSIPWLKDRIICKIKYMLDDIKERTYYPDFYLPNTNEFIEIKGYMWKSVDGRIDDERKFQLIKNSNPDMKISILMKNDLKSIGLKV